MIYTDEDGVLNIEYGHGSITGFATERHEDGSFGYGLASTDKGEVGRPCLKIDELVGRPDCDAGISVRFRFFKKESLDILIEDLLIIRKEMGK